MKLSEQQAAQIGAQVRRARRSRDWSGAELAEAAGVAGGTIVRIENGRPVRPGNLRAVLDALDIPPLTESESTTDDRVDLALDLVRGYMQAIPEGERDEALRELTRFCMLRRR